MLKENKITRYLIYAFGEIILVVVGILIALQINNWNELRKEGVKEQQLLENLASDFKESLIEHDRISLSIITSYESNVTLLNIIKSKEPIANTSEIDSLMNSILNDFKSLDLVSGTIDEIINTGSLHVIKDENLRKKLSNWSQIVSDTNDDVKITSEYIFNILIPSLKNDVLLRNTGIPKRIIEEQEISKIQYSSFHLDYNKTTKTIEFENKIYINALNLAYCISVYKKMGTYLKETLDLINANLK